MVTISVHLSVCLSVSFRLLLSLHPAEAASVSHNAAISC